MKEKDEKKKTSEFLAGIKQKATDIGKKTVDGVQKGAKAISEQTKKSLYEQKMKKYNPLFPEQYQSKDFHVPNMIKIVDDAERRGIDVCEGAIGWLGKENNVEVLYLYDEWLDESGLSFAPAAICNEIYVVDRFDHKKFVRIDSVFEISHSERIAELEHIAYSLGAKSCTIEITESSASYNQTRSQKSLVGNAKVVSEKSSVERESLYIQANRRSGHKTTMFSGHDNPKMPQLKWYAQDDNIKRLIEMKCADCSSVQATSLLLEGSSSATMSQTAAKEFDGAIKNMGYKTAVSFERKAQNEYSSKLSYEINF